MNVTDKPTIEFEIQIRCHFLIISLQHTLFLIMRRLVQRLRVVSGNIRCTFGIVTV